MGLRNPRIGFIGKARLTDEEKEALTVIGSVAGQLGHTIVLIPGTAGSDAVREGVTNVGGRLDEISERVIESANHTIIYADEPLLKKLQKHYPDMSNTTIIRADELVKWADALKELLTGPATSTTD